MKKLIISFTLLLGHLSLSGQVTYDTITINKQLEEVIVVQQKTQPIVEQRGNKMLVDMSAISQMPKFLGVSDPIRYLQSLAGISTNNETSAGIHIQGCDDYQSLTSINGAPVYYPNHLLGLYSTFIAPHFSTMTVEQSEHRGTMENRIGGLINMETQHLHPKRFSIEGNVGLISSDATLTIPCGKKSALWLSGRASYIDLLYGKWLQIAGIGLGYNFWDTNLTYAIHPTEDDEIVLTGFFGKDNIQVTDATNFGVDIGWYNAVGSAYWNHRLKGGNWRTTISYSRFENNISVDALAVNVQTKASWASVDIKNRFSKRLRDDMMLNASADYTHYFYQPLQFSSKGISNIIPQRKPMQYGEEASLGVDLNHSVNEWFTYYIGLHGNLYYNSKFFGNCDPRLTLQFTPVEDHEIPGSSTDVFFFGKTHGKQIQCHNRAGSIGYHCSKAGCKTDADRKVNGSGDFVRTPIFPADIIQDGKQKNNHADDFVQVHIFDVFHSDISHAQPRQCTGKQTEYHLPIRAAPVISNRHQVSRTQHQQLHTGGKTNVLRERINQHHDGDKSQSGDTGFVNADQNCADGQCNNLPCTHFTKKEFHLK